MKIDILLQDLKYTLRTLGRDPGFTIVAVLILALGIGANVAVFSVVNTLLLRPLPFPQRASSLVWIAPPPTKCGLSCATYSTDAYDEFRMCTPFLSGCDRILCLFQPRQPEPEPGRGAHTRHQHRRDREFLSSAGRASGDGAAVHGRRRAQWRAAGGAAYGRLVAAPVQRRSEHRGQGIRHERPADDRDRRAAEELRFWRGVCAGLKGRRHYAARISTALRATGETSSRSSAGSSRASPLRRRRRMEERLRRTCAGTTSSRRAAAVYKDGVVPVPLKDYVSGKLRRSLVVLWSAVGAILLIACVNLSNLMLARAAARTKEFAMRSALGAGRGRIVRQLLTESLVLSGAGAALRSWPGRCARYSGSRIRAPSLCRC